MARPDRAETNLDRTPPHNIDAERAVLGAMLLNPDAVGVAVEILGERPADIFYAEAHQHIYEAAVRLFRETTPIDAVTLSEELSRTNHLDDVGGVSYIADVAGAVPTSANVEYYSRIVLEAALLRKVISTCTLIAGEAYSAPTDVEELLDRAESGIFSIAEARQVNPVHPVGDLIPHAVMQIERLIKSHSGITGLATGFTKLDEILSGLQPSDMVVLAARPSVGKTAFALNVAAGVAVRQGKNVLIFSLEMSKEQLTQRLICLEGKINTQKLRTGYLAGREFQKVQQAADKLSGAQIHIDDTANITALEIRSKARKHKARHGLDLVVVDYMQLMRSPQRVENRQVEISEISRNIKGLARELGVPIIAISQLSREAERDDSGSPKLSHLRESGAIEQDADVVMMLSRPPAQESEGNENLIRLTIAKQRNGPTGYVDLFFEKQTQTFGDLADKFGPVPQSLSPPADAYSEEYEDDYDADPGGVPPGGFDAEELAPEDDDVPF